MKVSAVIPTRGDVDLTQILETVARCPQIAEVIIEKADGIWGRYDAIRRARFPVVYTQDDDIISDPGYVVRRYRPGVIVSAMTRTHAASYSGDISLVGFGAVFDKALTAVLDGLERDEVTMRGMDWMFTGLNRCENVFPEIEILDYAYGEDRLYRQPDIESIKRRCADRVAKIKAMAPAVSGA